MTTITYRAQGKTPGSPHFSSFVTKIVDRWQHWRSEREIESLSLDMRKDLGWPAADDASDHKDMR